MAATLRAAAAGATSAAAAGARGRPARARAPAVRGRGAERARRAVVPRAIDANATNGAAATAAPVVPAAPAAAPAPGLALPPPAVFNALVGASKAKASYSIAKTFVLGISAGMLIGMGGALMVKVGGASPALAAANPGLTDILKGLVGLPTGLSLVVLTGAELYTGNVMVMLSGLLTGAVDKAALVRSWCASYAGNFVGALLLAWLACVAQATASPAVSAAAAGVAVAKVSAPFAAAVAKGVLGNWLVCLAVWGATASQTVTGKMLAVTLPVSAFVALGFEHSVANMLLIPQGMLAGAPVSVPQMLFNNIIPVTIGNTLGAAVFVVCIHYFAYGRGK